MTDNTQKQADDKAKVIDLSAERKRMKKKAKKAPEKSSGQGFSLGNLSFSSGASSLSMIFQLLVFLLVIFFFMRECGGGM